MNVAPRAFELARYGSFVLAEQAADFSQRTIVSVVISKAQTIARIEFAQRHHERSLQKGEILGALRIVGRIGRAGCRDLSMFFACLVLEWFRPARASNFVHVPLCEHGAKPCAELAASVKIFEQRFSAAPGIAQAVQITVKRIGKLARVSILPGVTAGNGTRGTVELGPKLRHEKIPRRRTAEAARARKREVGCVERLQVRFDFLW